MSQQPDDWNDYQVELDMQEIVDKWRNDQLKKRYRTIDDPWEEEKYEV